MNCRPAHPRSTPWKRVVVCQGNVRPVALKTSDHEPEDSAKHADAPQARLPRLRIGIFRGSSSICLFCLGKRGTMQSRSSLLGVNVTSNPDLRDSCWIDNTEVPPNPRCSPDRSPEVLVLYLERPDTHQCVVACSSEGALQIQRLEGSRPNGRLCILNGAARVRRVKQVAWTSLIHGFECGSERR